MSEPTDDLRAQAAEWQQRAQYTVDLLVKAARESKGSEGWHVVEQIYHADNQFFLAMIIGNLTMRIVNAERRAEQSHGPLVTLEEQGLQMPEMPMWATTLSDQMAAAIEHGDYKAYATMAVDANLRAYAMDVEAAMDVDYDYILRSVLVLDQHSTALLAAEALRRLYELKGGA